jgi:hypothetical protein
MYIYCYTCILIYIIYIYIYVFANICRETSILALNARKHSFIPFMNLQKNWSGAWPSLVVKKVTKKPAVRHEML